MLVGKDLALVDTHGVDRAVRRVYLIESHVDDCASRGQPLSTANACTLYISTHLALAG